MIGSLINAALAGFGFLMCMFCCKCYANETEYDNRYRNYRRNYRHYEILINSPNNVKEPYEYDTHRGTYRYTHRDTHREYEQTWDHKRLQESYSITQTKNIEYNQDCELPKYDDIFTPEE